jgi:hypothetical protein
MRTFHPFLSEDVRASSPPHAAGTVYRVSLGIEYWEEGPEEVAKIQMVYDNVVSGRRSPSFPSGTDDFQRVIGALRRLEDKAKHMPMSADRFRAFRPNSPDVTELRREVREGDLNRIVTKARSFSEN